MKKLKNIQQMINGNKKENRTEISWFGNEMADNSIIVLETQQIDQQLQTNATEEKLQKLWTKNLRTSSSVPCRISPLQNTCVLLNVSR